MPMKMGFVADRRTTPRATARQSPPRGGTIGRFLQIAFRTTGYLLWLLFYRLSLFRHPTPARRFADFLENLGTSFVKLGQHLSLRADLFPPEYLA
jgi:ubiquinone biosynthesis protein